MKRLTLLFITLTLAGFGFNFTGTWVNRDAPAWGDPVKLKIVNQNVTPTLRTRRGNRQLIAKRATSVGGPLLASWHVARRFEVLHIRPINNRKLRVTVKRLYCNDRAVQTRSYIFKKKIAPVAVPVSRFLGNWVNNDPFSGIIHRMAIRNPNGNRIRIRAWRLCSGGECPIGTAIPTRKKNQLFVSWRGNGRTVNAIITGIDYNPNRGRYRTLRIDIISSSRGGYYENRQRIFLHRVRHHRSGRARVYPRQRHLQIGPFGVDVELP